MNNEAEIVFLSHGGGPLPLLGDSGHQALVDYLQALPEKLRSPSAILLISAHWEADIPQITSAANPGLIYDYYGFPPESYDIKYPAPGEPGLAKAVAEALNQAGIANELNGSRGFDHGLFVPLKIMFPDADIPCVQLSLNANMNAESHLAMGKALQFLNVDNLLVIGSGFSFHNMREFFAASSAESGRKNAAFEQWLQTIISEPAMSEQARWEMLANWEAAPHARFCHPREEHLLPLHVCYGLAQRQCDSFRSVEVLGKSAGMVHWYHG
ncbi:class III extradiol ring-cleavage dioxygenase [Pseudohongiella nitratireducens]|uniref:DODA-type extradiol aromatic ring-opening family dioxygenase n=1 Tax=Pseudohongiella nitratireducens TaxID=1768907 RepID=UPI0030EE1206|tara:strand:- start:3063 stop:3869 length:807 start_codon:yes stop_codon:yes gene_type:complete